MPIFRRAIKETWGDASRLDLYRFLVERMNDAIAVIQNGRVFSSTGNISSVAEPAPIAQPFHLEGAENFLAAHLDALDPARDPADAGAQVGVPSFRQAAPFEPLLDPLPSPHFALISPLDAVPDPEKPVPSPNFLDHIGPPLILDCCRLHIY